MGTRIQSDAFNFIGIKQLYRAEVKSLTTSGTTSRSNVPQQTIFEDAESEEIKIVFFAHIFVMKSAHQ